MFVSVDISSVSLVQAKARVREAGLGNVTFQKADVFSLPFAEAHFDHVFVCFVLEHLVSPGKALAELRRVLKPGGTLTVIEGDHGSAYFHPDSEFARRAIQCLVDLQRHAGGDASSAAGCIRCSSRPASETCACRRAWYTSMRAGRLSWTASSARPSRPWSKGWASRRSPGTDRGGIWRKGIRDLYRTAEADGTFCYTFFKAIGAK